MNVAEPAVRGRNRVIGGLFTGWRNYSDKCSRKARAARANVSVLGPLPQGLPTFAIPWIAYSDIVPVLIGGCAVALISFADTSILSRTYAARLGTKVDPNQEMVGLGAANVAAGFFHGFPVSSSSSRTPIAEAAGAQTQLTGIVGALAVALLLLLAPNLLKHLPSAALAAVVVASAIGLFEVADLRRIFRIQRWEFWLSDRVTRAERPEALRAATLAQWTFWKTACSIRYVLRRKRQLTFLDC